MNCTCPHHYTATGLQRYGTDACCPVHGAPKAPEPVETRPRVPESVKWCLECGTEHARGVNCPDYD